MLPRIALLMTALFGIGVARAAGYPEFDEPVLKLGRQIWLGTCEACHANSMSEAPQVKRPGAWEARIAKGRDVLDAHALGGYVGKSGEEMPPRGGNPKLSDDEVKAALEYMLKLVTISKGESK